MPEWINERIQDILSSVILYGSPNESEGTTDCYMKYPDDSKKWVKYDNKEFFDTLAYCLDATVDEKSVYCRHFTNKKGEIIKFENAIEISSEEIEEFIRGLSYGDRWIIAETASPINEMKSFILLCKIFPKIIPKPKGFEVFFMPIEDYIDQKIAYEELFHHLLGIYKNENEFSIDYYVDHKENNFPSKPIVISKEYIKGYLKYIGGKY